MPKLGNKKFKYTQKGMKAYIKALKKRRKKTGYPRIPDITPPGGN